MFFKYGMFSINEDWSIDIRVDDYIYYMRYVLNFDLQEYLTSVFLDVRKKLVKDIAKGKLSLTSRKIIIYASKWQPKRFIVANT